MKKILSQRPIAVILLAVTLLSLAFYVYMIARPISYGMEYTNEEVYEGEVFKGTMVFKADSTMINRNSNFDMEMTSYYYCKNRYLFFTIATNEEDYAAEVEEINEKFDVLIQIPFYAYKVNAFGLSVDEGDGYVSLYTCTPAIVFAAVGGAVELILIALTCTAFALSAKGKKQDPSGGSHTED